MATTDIGRAVPLMRGEYSPFATYELNDIVTLNGSMYWHYSHTMTTNVAPQATDTWMLVLDLTAAEEYISRAESAAETAEEAKDDAVTAKTAAETASASASGSSTAANAAANAAASAAEAAIAAMDAAVSAKTDAESAKTAAQTAATAASGSATAANSSAGNAEYYAGEASTAATTATGKADEASTSAATASAAATTATGAKDTAVSSAATATTKAGEASTSATSAASSAAAAQAVKDSIPQDYTALSEDVADLKAQITSNTKNLFNSDWLLEASGWVKNDGEYYGVAQNLVNTYKRDAKPFPFGSFESNTQYTISMYAKVEGEYGSGTESQNQCFRIIITYTDNTNDTICGVSNLLENYTKITGTSAANKTILKINTSYGSGWENTLYLKEVQCEKGSSATDYVPNLTAKDLVSREAIASILLSLSGKAAQSDVDSLEVQINKLTNAVKKQMDFITQSVIEKKYINGQNGVVGTGDQWYCTDFIPIPESTVNGLLIFTCSFYSYVGCAFYGSSQQYVSGYSGTSLSIDSLDTRELWVQIPQNAAYFRCTLHKNVYNSPSDFGIYLQNSYGIDELSKTVQEHTTEVSELQSLKIPYPVYPESKHGTEGQVLQTDGLGNTKWATVGMPTDEQVESVIDNWLDEHPEATTTIQDGAVTEPKINTAFLPVIKNDYVTPEMFDGSVSDALSYAQTNGCLFYADSITLESDLELYNVNAYIKNVVLNDNDIKISASPIFVTGGGAYSRNITIEHILPKNNNASSDSGKVYIHRCSNGHIRFNYSFAEVIFDCAEGPIGYSEFEFYRVYYLTFEGVNSSGDLNWINENVFRLHNTNQYKVKNTLLSFDNNYILHGCFEGNNAEISIEKGTYNTFDHIRFEPHLVNGEYVYNAKVTFGSQAHNNLITYKDYRIVVDDAGVNNRVISDDLLELELKYYEETGVKNVNSKFTGLSYDSTNDVLKQNSNSITFTTNYIKLKDAERIVIDTAYVSDYPLALKYHIYDENLNLISTEYLLYSLCRADGTYYEDKGSGRYVSNEIEFVNVRYPDSTKSWENNEVVTLRRTNITAQNAKYVVFEILRDEDYDTHLATFKSLCFKIFGCKTRYYQDTVYSPT